MNGSHDLHHLQVDQGGGDHGGGDGGGGDGGQLKKGPWTAAEDSVLTEYVRKHGEGNWNAVQRNTGLARCGKSCRLRWANHLRPNLKKGAFSPEEERLIVELHAQLGNKWARMAAQLPGRTDNEIKNYWNTRVKRRHRQGLPLYPQEIQTQQPGGNHQHHPYHHQQYHHHHHHHQQQQQQQLLQQQQAPQSPHSHHSHHHQSPASTPTTPTSSFTFSTTPTAAAAAHHYFSRSPTPNCLSPTPPPPLSPSSALHSPHYHRNQTLPTLSLFDSTTTTNPTSFNVIHRAPPILQTPLRFKRFHADNTNSSGGATTTNSPCTTTTTAANNFNINYNNDHNNNNNFNTNAYQNGNFSLPYSTFLRSPTSVSTPPPPQQPNCNAFSNTNSSTMLMSLHQQPPFTSNPNTVPFVSNNSSTSNILRTQFEKDYNTSSTNNNFPNNSVFAMKPELPSSQFYSHHHNGSSPELAFIDNNNDQKLSLSGGGGSGLLEDLLDETTAHMSNSMEDKRDFSGFNNHWSDSNSLNLSPGTLKPKEETAADQNNNNNNTAMHEDLSKIFNSINNPSMQLPAEWYNDTGTGSGEEASNGHSSVVTTDENNMISLDQMHQIASMFRVDDSSSQEHDHHHLNLPGIC